MLETFEYQRYSTLDEYFSTPKGQTVPVYSSDNERLKAEYEPDIGWAEPLRGFDPDWHLSAELELFGIKL